MVKCSICKANHNFFHYCYDGNSKPFVQYPTCKKCFNKAKRKPKTEDDIFYSDELALFRIKKLEKRISRLEKCLKGQQKGTDGGKDE